MKFMATWSVEQDKWIPVMTQWSSMTPKERADAGDGVKIIGRWHNMGERTGVAIFEASDAAALFRYIGMWNTHMNVDVSPVLDDEDSAKAAKALVAAQG